MDLFIQYFDIAKRLDTGLKALFSLKQGVDESNFDFVRRFKMLAHVCKTPFMGRQLYDLFMNALRLQVHLEILKANPTSYEDVIDNFLTYEAFEI